MASQVRIAFLVDVHDRFEAVPAALREIGLVDLLIIGGDITTAGTPADATPGDRELASADATAAGARREYGLARDRSAP